MVISGLTFWPYGQIFGLEVLIFGASGFGLTYQLGASGFLTDSFILKKVC